MSNTETTTMGQVDLMHLTPERARELPTSILQLAGGLASMALAPTEEGEEPIDQATTDAMTSNRAVIAAELERRAKEEPRGAERAKVRSLLDYLREHCPQPADALATLSTALVYVITMAAKPGHEQELADILAEKIRETTTTMVTEQGEMLRGLRRD